VSVTLNSTGEKPPVSAYRWHDVRFIGAVLGRYVLPERRQNGRDKIPAYACRLCSISTRLLVVFGPLIGEKGEYVSCHFDEFGIIRGKIVRRLAAGFVVDIMMTESERDKLGAKIDWLKKRIHDQVPEKREYKRMRPRDPGTVIITGAGERIPCLVMDVSRSGVAVSADYWPHVGTPLAVGRLVGRVVRYLDVGFAVQFKDVQESDDLDNLLQPLAS
jgi:hypothetical protein